MTVAPLPEEPAEHEEFQKPELSILPGLPERFIPPPGGFTADDLDRIPDLPPHTELIDGSLVFVSPQASFHTLVLFMLEAGLRQTLPENLRIRREMTVTLSPRQRPEPDLMVLHASAIRGVEETSYLPTDVALAVEVVSPDSAERDRERKPQLYAQAGIPHFWRVENVSGQPAVYAYELDVVTHAYVATGVHRERLKVSVPYDIDIDLTQVSRL